jgi:mono/diheme cytochrome c family protein
MNIKRCLTALITALPLVLHAQNTNAPTYVKDILPIVMTKCFTCHHPKSLLPDWTNYKTMVKKKTEVRRRIWNSWEQDLTRHYYKQPMPAGYGLEALTITTKERETIKNWIDAGTPYGTEVVVAINNTSTGWLAPADAFKLVNPVPANDDTLAKGKSLFTVACQPCHGALGQGNGIAASSLLRNGKPIAPANLSSPSVQSQPDGSFFWKIKEGNSPMPSWKTALTDEQCWQIVDYIRTLAHKQ